MILKEEQMDLFTTPQGYYLAHCISGDYALGAGVAKQFDEIYNMREKLFSQYPIPYDMDGSKNYDNYIGCSLLVDNVFNLITKERCYHKPTYDALRSALINMRDQMIGLKTKKLSMPRIGCGLDRLEWDKVKEIIEDVFKDTYIEILVCVL